MDIIQPERWDISIWKENGIWYEKYNEYVPDTKENREALDKTINLLNKSKILPTNIIKIEKDNMIGMEIFIKTADFKIIANQLTSEFIYFSPFGDITIKELFKFILIIGLKKGVVEK
ncbi:hypothetical protein LCGC14_0224110 [marine sediment metagenome]|uniref:Uncharacterized protein n=1 Tax=marine sediment metagenome TaxID=412755 RepID=A0A0F9XG18_9ZZZZ